MQLSAAGLELIKRSEGFRGQVYIDVAGFPTIGYGHRVTPQESFPGGIGEAQAAAMLAKDVGRSRAGGCPAGPGSPHPGAVRRAGGLLLQPGARGGWRSRVCCGS